MTDVFRGAGTHAGIGALNSIREGMDLIFLKYAGELQGLKTSAEAVSSAIETAGSFIERHTSEVCPGCPEVCCINRHSYHGPVDLVCIYALGERPPLHKEGVGDSEPCQFLGKDGCTIRRPLRPHRCNWYFCAPLLDHIQTVSARQYRMFIAAQRTINQKREELLDVFLSILKRAGYDLEGPGRATDEIFFR
jgi:hypothetical protein